MLLLEKLRREKGISQAELARRIGANPSSISRIEHGLEPLFPLRGQRISKVLGWDGDPDNLIKEVQDD